MWTKKKNHIKKIKKRLKGLENPLIKLSINS